MIEVYQSGILPNGQFDVRDSDASSIKGGEVLVLDEASSSDYSTADTYNGSPRIQLRLATDNDVGPFFLANVGGGLPQSTPYKKPFYSPTVPKVTSDASSKQGAFTDEGFYAISSDSFESDITSSTRVNAPLYVSANGKLTSVTASSNVPVGYLIEYRQSSVVNGDPSRSYKAAGTFSGKDSIIILKSNTPDGYTQTGISAFGRLVTVSSVGGEFTTIEDALLAVASLTPPPSETNPVIIKVAPGTYSVNNPIIVPEGVTIDSNDTASTGDVVISAQNASLDVFQLVGTNSAIGGLRIKDGYAGIRVSMPGALDHVYIERVKVTECTFGLIIEEGEVHTRSLDIEKANGTMQVGLHVAGGDIASNDLQIVGRVGLLLPKGIVIENGGRTHFGSTRLEFCSLAVEVLTAGILHMGGACDILSSTDGVYVNNAVAYTSGLNVRPTADSDPGTDLEVIGASSEVFWTGGRIRTDRTIVETAARRVVIAAPSIREVNLDPSFIIKAELSVGTESEGRESAFGGGDSHQRGMKLLTNTNGEVGTWVDVTSDWEDPTVIIPVFAGVTAGYATYLGGDVEFPNAKMDIVSPIILGAGAVIFEYWNGSAWTEVVFMVTDADFPYMQYANAAFARASNDEQYRWGELSGWTKKTLNGENKFWIRARIVSTITTSPTSNFTKLGTNRTEINQDGRVEYFGNAEPRRELLVHQGLASDLSGATPTNESLPLTTNITLAGSINGFNNNATDGFGEIITIPEGIDTSEPLSIEVVYFPQTDQVASDVELEMNYAVLDIGDPIDGTVTDTNIAIVDSLPANIGTELRKVIFELDIPSASPGEFVAFSLFRDASAGNLEDTYPSGITVVSVRAFGYFWQ